jgi:hypothetical protein
MVHLRWFTKHANLFAHLFGCIRDRVATVLNEQAVYQSFYSDPKIFCVAGPSACLLLDFGLHHSGLGKVASIIGN